MSATLETPTVEFPTVADLLARLGDVSPERIRLDPPPGTATNDDLLHANETERHLPRYELVDGTLVEKAVGYWESTIAAVLIQLIGNWLDEHGEGIVSGADGMMELSSITTRIPDVGFVSWGQLPERRVPREPIPTIHPDLAIEVLSTGNRPDEMRRRREDYFAAGTSLVWEIDPRARTLTVHTSPEESATFADDAVVDGGDVLPGFTITLAEVIERADRPGSTKPDENHGA